MFISHFEQINYLWVFFITIEYNISSKHTFLESFAEKRL